MTEDKLTIGMLFPFRKKHEALEMLCRDYPVEIVHTPYIETNELRSSRGLHSGKNIEQLPEPEIDNKYLEDWQRCNALVGMDIPSNPEQLFPNLLWFQGVSAGYDHIDSVVLRKMGVIQTNARGISSPAIAEFVFSRILQVWKDLRLLDSQQAEKTWRVRFGTQAIGKTIGIVGLGSIGRAIATRARAFGMNVLAVRKTANTGMADNDVDQLFSVNDVQAMIRKSDVVVMAAPATEETRDMFDHEMFTIMKQGAIFCNVARGMHVVEEALVSALTNSHLRAAILDVTRMEPLPIDSPLWSAPNMYLSPHCSVSFDTYEENAIELLVENAKLMLANKELINSIVAS
tara:strand:- start:324 stop:1358 length:1035 start_codon:yes stop_codon:yes gene_type:complete